MAADPFSEEQGTEHTILFDEEPYKQSRKGSPLLQNMQRLGELTLPSGMGATIENLPSEILEEIFQFYRQDIMTFSRGRPWEWHRLVHVCQYIRKTQKCLI